MTMTMTKTVMAKRKIQTKKVKRTRVTKVTRVTKRKKRSRKMRGRMGGWGTRNIIRMRQMRKRKANARMMTKNLLSIIHLFRTAIGKGIRGSRPSETN